MIYFRKPVSTFWGHASGRGYWQRVVPCGGRAAAAICWCGANPQWWCGLMAVADWVIAPSSTAAPLAGTPPAVTPVRLYFTLLSIVGLAAFVFGLENRLSSGGLFALPPPVDWLPPLSQARWDEAF